MLIVDKFSKTIWEKEDKKSKNLESKIKIPNHLLEKVDQAKLRKTFDFEKIPDKGGCYWLWTNEPVLQRLHKKCLPKKFIMEKLFIMGLLKMMFARE